MKDTKQQSTITAPALASLCGCSERRLYQMAESGQIPKPENGQWPATETLRALFAYYRKGGQQADELKIQQTRREKQLADKLTRQNAIARGELCRWEDVLRILNEKICVPWRLALDGAPEEAREWRDKCLLPILRESLEPPKSP